ALALEALELLMGHHPALVLAAAAALLLRADAAKPAPLPDGEFGLAQGAGHLLGGVPVLRRLALGQGGQRRLDPVQSPDDLVQPLRVAIHVYVPRWAVLVSFSGIPLFFLLLISLELLATSPARSRRRVLASLQLSVILSVDL